MELSRFCKKCSSFHAQNSASEEGVEKHLQNGLFSQNGERTVMGKGLVRRMVWRQKCPHYAAMEALQMAGSWDDSRTTDEIVSQLRQERTTRRVQEGV
jgi:hypothetical protein